MLGFERVASLLVPSFCWACGATARVREPLCTDCRGALAWIDPGPERLSFVPVCAPLSYEGPARALVRALKYRGATALAGPIAAMIAATVPPEWFEGAVLVPVPLDPRRLRRRGYNQAELIATALGRRVGAEVADVLERVPLAGAQVGRSRYERRNALCGTVTLRAGVRPPRSVVLVDDVVTTGSTLEACAEGLSDGRMESFGAVAFARTPGR